MDSEKSTFPVALDYVRCNGQENTLKDCIHFSHSYGCGHEDDLAVHCQPGSYHSKSLAITPSSHLCFIYSNN